MVRLRVHRCSADPTLLIVTADARSLVANRGDLIPAVREAGRRVVALVPNVEHLDALDRLDIDLDGLREACRFRSVQSADDAPTHGVACDRGATVSLAAATPMRWGAR